MWSGESHWCRLKKVQLLFAGFGACKEPQTKRSGHFLEWGKGKKAVSPPEPQERNAALQMPWSNPVRAVWDFWRPGQWVHTFLLLLAMNYSAKRELNFIQIILLFGLQFINFWCKSWVVFPYLVLMCPCDSCSYTEETFSEYLWVICLFESIHWVHA